MTSKARLAQRLALVVITDPSAPLGPVAAAEAALSAGAPAIQLRWKDAGAREMLDLALLLREATRRHGALLIINDRLDVAIAADADGVHLGDDDLPVRAARRLREPPFLIGRSVDTPADASAAEAEGADYVGLGPIYPTSGKVDVGPVLGPSGILAVRKATTLPIVAIGGIAAGRARAAILGGGLMGSR